MKTYLLMKASTFNNNIECIESSVSFEDVVNFMKRDCETEEKSLTNEEIEDCNIGEDWAILTLSSDERVWWKIQEVDIDNTKNNFEWLNEPNWMKFYHKNYKCEIKRIDNLGHLCGYVHIPNTDKTYKYTEEQFYNQIVVHGDITYFEKNDLEIVVGFDCAHYNDLIPKLWLGRAMYESYNGSTYKNIDYVTNQCISMVEQIIEMKIT